MDGKPRTDIEPILLKAEIEAVFQKRNIDSDCDTIACLLEPYRKAVCESLRQGNHADAVTILLEVFESLSYHFVQDGHYDYFDDMYSPDYVCLDMMKAVMDAIRSGHFPTKEAQRLKDGMEKLKHTEAYEEYGVPFAIGEWEKFRTIQD